MLNEVRALVFDVFGTVVDWPFENGPAQSGDLAPAQDWDVMAADFGALADRFGG